MGKSSTIILLIVGGSWSSSNAGSDYMSYTKVGYPASFATEGDPLNGGFPGDFNPYVHGVNDTMDVDDDTGFFSLEVSLQFQLR